MRAEKTADRQGAEAVETCDVYRKQSGGNTRKQKTCTKKQGEKEIERERGDKDK